MPVFPLTLTPDGATLDVGVSAPTAYVTQTPRPGTWTALVDTGATMTVISPAVVLALQPPRIGVTPVGRSGGVRTLEPTSEIRVRLGGHRNASRWFALEVVEIQPATPDVALLIGTDLLIQLELMWWGPPRRAFLSY